jgi:pilus assembly protein CpaE
MYRLSICAHVLDDETGEVLRRAMGDISLVRSRLEVLPGGIEGALERYSKGEDTADLLIVQSEDDEEALKEDLDRLSRVVSPGTQVIVVGTVDRIDFYRDVLHMGVGEYLLGPLTLPALMRSVKSVFGADKSSARGRTIAFVGAKGGVGSSTLCHNVAWSLARLFGRPTTVVDLDLHFGTVALDFNHEHRYGLRDALNQAAQNGSVDEVFLERLFSKDSDNLWLLASAPTLADASQVVSPEALEAVLDTAARMADFVVLDVPHVWNAAVGGALLVADEVVVVTEPTLAGLRNAQLLFEAIGPGKPAGTFLRYVVNHSGMDRGTEVGAKDFSEALGSAASATVPWQPATFRFAAEQGRMVGDTRKNAKVAAQMDELARIVAGRKEPEAAKAAAGGFLSSLLGRNGKARPQ